DIRPFSGVPLFENNYSGLRKMEATESRNRVIFFGFFRASPPEWLSRAGVAKEFKLIYDRFRECLCLKIIPPVSEKGKPRSHGIELSFLVFSVHRWQKNSN